MKSPLRRRISPSVPFTLTFEDEQGVFTASYQLAYNLNSMALVELELNKSMLTSLGELLENPTATSVSVMFWAALQENHSDEFEGEDGLRLVRTNLTVAQTRSALAACAKAYIQQLPKEQQQRLTNMVEGREAGEEAAVPLA
jgi:uncharacterized membrane protein YccC